MPDLRRFLTRAGEEYSLRRGSTDRLCSHRRQLHRHPHQQGLFIDAMREALAWHCLQHRELAQACLEADCWPDKLRFMKDLDRLPQVPPLLHSPARVGRDVRRWNRVAHNLLCELGWSRPRRKAWKAGQATPLASALSTSPELALVARCSFNHWHWPQVVHCQGNRYFTPVYQSQSCLSWPGHTNLKQNPCPCGWAGPWMSEIEILA